MYRALARKLPQPAVWGCTPLSRTRKTAEAIFDAGYPAQDVAVFAGMIEQNLGELQGIARETVPSRLLSPPQPTEHLPWPGRLNAIRNP